MIALFCAFFLHAVEVIAQCSPVPIIETVDNGNFEKGDLKSNGTKYPDGTSVLFKSDKGYAGDFDPAVLPAHCSNITDLWGVGRATANKCGNGDVNNPYAGSSYLNNALFKDHTPGQAGKGNAFIIDFYSCTGANAISNPAKTYSGGKPVAWAQDVTIQPNQNYYFSSWFAQYTFNPAAGLKLNFVVIPYVGNSNTLDMANRQVIGTVNPSKSTMNWEQFYGTWNSLAFTKALITIEMDATDPNDCLNAGDFAIDDISFINGCQNIASATLKPDLGANFSFCRTNGTYTLNSKLETNAGDGRQFSWFSGTGNPQTVLVNASLTQNKYDIIAPGTYRVCVSEAASGTCASSSTIVIDNTMSVVVNANDLCSPAISTVTATVTPVPTTGIYTYAWTGMTPDPGNVSSFTTDKPGTFNVKVSNSAVNGCNAASPNKTIVSLMPTYAAPAVQCLGATVTMTGLGTGTNAPNYKWWSAATGGTLVGSGANPAFTFPTTGTSYSVYLEDATATPLTGSPLGASPTVDHTTNLNTTLTVTQPITLTSVDVKLIYNANQTAETYKIELFNTATSTVDQSLNYMIPYGSNATVPLNFKIPAGSYALRIRTAAGGAVSDRFAGVTGSPSIAGYIKYAGQDTQNGSPFGKFVVAQSNGCDRVKVDIPLQNCCTKPVISTQPAAQTVCVGATATYTIALAANPASAIVKWQKTADTTNTASFSDITNTTNTLTTANTLIGDNGTWYRVVTQSTANCIRNSWWAKLMVNPKPTVNAVNPAPICSETATDIALVSTPAGATFSWVLPVSVPANAITGGAVGTNVTGPIKQTLTNGTAASATLTYSVTATLNGCTGSATDIVQTVKPLPVVDPVTPARICSGETTNIILASTPAGATFSWPDPATQGGMFTGGLAGTNVTGPIKQTLITSSTSKTFSLLYTVTATLNGCDGSAVQIFQPVGPKPVISAGAHADICSGETTNIKFSSTSSGTVYSGMSWSWTTPVSSPVNAVTGGASGTTGGPNMPDVTNPIAQVLTNNTGATATLTYTITGVFDGCPSLPLDIVQNVKPKPTVTPVSPGAICTGDKTNIALTSSISGSTFSWVTPVSAPVNVVTGGSAATNVAGPIAQTLTNNTDQAAKLTYAVTATLNGCTGAAENIVQTVNPAPKVNAVTTTAICSGDATNIALVSTPAGASFSWITPVSVPANAVKNGASGTNTAGPIQQTLTNVTNAAGVLTYVVKATANGCTGPATNIDQTVNPLPVVDAVSPADICSASSTSIALASTPAGAKFTWATPVSTPANAVTGGSGATDVSGPIVQALVNTTNLSATLTYEVKATLNNCTGVATNIVQTVKPVSTITLSSAAGTDAQTKCINTSITAITYAVGNATGATVTGLPAGLTNNYASGVFTISGKPTASGTFNYTVTVSGGCTAPTISGKIVVTPDPTIVLSSAIGTDAQSVCVNKAVTPIAYTITDATDATVTGLPAGVTGSYASGVFTISGTPAADGVFTYIVTAVGGCTAPTVTGKITVTSSSAIALSSAAGTDAQTKCINTAATNITYTIIAATGATVSGLPNGLTGAYAAGVFTISGTPTESGSFSYTVSVTGGCTAPTATGTVTVNPLATITLSSAAATANQDICLTSALADITYTVGNATGASVTGLPAGLTNVYTAGVFKISGTPTATGTFTYTVTVSGGCGTPASSGTIIVDPCPYKPDFTLSTTSACLSASGQATVTITPKASGATTWKWDFGTVGSYSTTQALTDNGTNGAVMNDPATPFTVTYTTPGIKTITLTVTGPAGSAPKSYSLNYEVGEIPVVSGSDAEICSGKSPNIALSSSVNVSTFAWVAPVASPSGSVSGGSAGTGPNINQVLTAASNGKLTYTVVATGPAPTFCKSIDKDIIVTVNPLPEVTVPADIEVCSGSAFAAPLQLTSTVSGAAISWTSVSTDATGSAGSGSNVTSINETLTATSASNPMAAGKVVYSVSSTGPAPTNCPSAVKTVAVTVNPLPVITAIPDQTICSGQSTTAVTPVSNITGTTYTYTASATSAGGTVSGFSGSATPVSEIPAQTLTSDSKSQETVSYVISAVSPKGCKSTATQTFNIKVDAPALATVALTSLSSCTNPQTLPGNEPPAGQTVKWNKISGDGILTKDTQFDAQVSLDYQEQGTYAMTVTSGLCTATSDVVTVKRSNKEEPSVSLTVDKNAICEGTPVVFTATGTGGNDAIRTFEFVDANNSANILQATSLSNKYTPNPALSADISVKVIMNAYSTCLAPNSSNTPESNVVTVIVDKNPDQPVFTDPDPLNMPLNICGDSYNLVLAPVTIGTVSWKADLTATFTPATGVTTKISGIDKGKTYTVTATNHNGVCLDKTAQVTINRSGDMTTPDAGIDQEVCFDPAGYTFLLKGNAVAANGETGKWTVQAPATLSPVQNSNTDASVSITAAQAGTSFSYIYTISNGICPDNSDVVVVKMLPELNLNSLVSSDAVCGNTASQQPSNAQLVIATAQTGVTYTAKAAVGGQVLATATATNAGSLTINIAADKLPVDGVNQIEIYAEILGKCPQQLLINKPVVNRVGVISDITPDVNFCADLAAASYQWNVVGGTGADGFDWSQSGFAANPAPVYSNNTATVDAAWGNASGKVIVVPNKKDAAGTITACPNLTYTENVNVVPLFDNTEVLDPLAPTICAGDAVQFTISKPSANTTYSYTKPADATGSAIVNNGFTVNFPTSGDIIVNRFYTACPAYQPDPLKAIVTVIERPVASIAGVAVQPSMAELTLDGSKSTPLPKPGYTYTWNALGGGSITGVQNDNTTKVTPSELISYYELTISASGSNTCASTATVRVEVRVLLEFPNVFSPNGDGTHDFFAVKNSEFFHNAKMEIFNQWGDKVYVHKGLYVANWDGTNNGNDLPVATYYYIYTPNQEGYDAVAGSISILR